MMGADAQLKRYFPAVILCLIAVAAYFQASGIGQLVGASLGDSSPPAAPPSKSAKTTPAPPEQRPSGAAILARNPFDSKTGPLDGQPIPEPTREPTAEPSGDPYADPVCDSAKVLLITASDDPSWSFAAISSGSDKASLRRIGDDVGGRTVSAMVWDRVWMTKDGARCQLPLHSAPAASAAAKAPPIAAPGGITPAQRGAGGTVPKEIADKIHQISENQIDVDRSVVGMIMEKQGELFRSVRISPSRDGDGAGLKLGGIKPGSLLGSLGLVNGDKLLTVNGFEMSDPTKALEAYTRLQAADKISVRVVRGGKPVTVDINMR